VETTIGGEFSPDAAVATIAISPKPGIAFVVPIAHPEAPWKDPYRVLGIIGRALAYTDAKRVAHNAKFDDRWISEFGVEVRADFDTMIAAHVLDENRFKALKYLAQLILGVDPWADVDTTKAMEQPLSKLARYNAKDADYTLRLYYEFRNQLTSTGNARTLRIFSKLLMPASRALTDIERTGMYVDQQRLLERRLQLDENLEKIDRLLTKRVGHSANWNSIQQVAKILFGEMKFPMFDITKKGAPSTKESVMLRLSVMERAKGKNDAHNVPALILKHRELQKNKGTYFENWAALTDKNSRIHTSYKLFGTVTGRLSSGKENKKERGFNAQQIPRNPFMRSVFGAPPGWKHVEADFSQVELRIAAHISQEPTMKRLFQLGQDIHLATAMQVTGKSAEAISSEERKKAKAVNFGFLYGMGYKKFVDYARDNYGVHVELEEAKAVRERFFSTFSGLRPWHERQRRLVRNYGRVQSLIGRIRHLPDIESGDEEIRKEAERQAINSPVQSMASDMMLIALIYLHERMPPDEAKVTGTVHDSILFEIREDCVDHWVSVMRETMENLPLKKLFGAELSVPITVDIKVGDHWSEGVLV
jgi:DNA polymerase-1